MYLADTTLIDSSLLYQGDVITDFPFPVLEGSKKIKKDQTTGQFELDESSSQETESLFAIEKKLQTVMILSQTCDLQRRKNVIICPVYSLKDFIEDNVLNKSTVESIRKRSVNYWFYLPEYKNLEESIVDLQTMVYVSRTTLGPYLSKRIIILSDLGRHHLSWSVVNYFGRPAMN